MKRKFLFLEFTVLAIFLLITSCNSNLPANNGDAKTDSATESLSEDSINKSPSEDGKVVITSSETEKAEGDSTTK